MKILIEVEEDDKVNRSAECEVSPEESVDALAKRIAGQLGLEAEELVADLGVGDVRFEPNARVGDYIEHGKRWRHRRVCIDLRFGERLIAFVCYSGDKCELVGSVEELFSYDG